MPDKKDKKEVKKQVGRDFLFLVKEMDYYDKIKPVEKSKIVSKFSNQLTYQGKIEEIANKIVSAAKEIKLTSGRGPTGVCAAATYIASILAGEKKTQREIAKMAQVTEVTVRNRYKELVERLNFRFCL